MKLKFINLQVAARLQKSHYQAATYKQKTMHALHLAYVHKCQNLQRIASDTMTQFTLSVHRTERANQIINNLTIQAIKCPLSIKCEFIQTSNPIQCNGPCHINKKVYVTMPL
jgi:hypothetical protein